MMGRRRPKLRKLSRGGPPGGVTRYIAYARVSDEEQVTDGLSLPAQEEKFEAYCKLTDSTLIDTLKDEGKSARSMRGRENLKEALERIHAGEADGLMVIAIDRFARCALDFLELVKELREAGKVFVSIRESFDMSTPFGWYAAGTMAMAAELESNLNSVRVKEVVEYLRSQNRLVGGVPYGFEVDVEIRRDRKGKDVEIKNLIENPEEIEVVRRICALRMAPITKGKVEVRGLGYRVIANRLNEESIPSKGGGKWYPMTVQRIFSYAPDLFPGILDDLIDRYGPLDE